MASSAHAGPVVAYGQAPAADYNLSAPCPSLFNAGVGILDPRSYYGYSPGGRRKAHGFLSASRVCTLDVVPSALAAANIAAAQVPVAGTALTLVSSTGSGVTVGQSVVNPNTGVATAATLLALDGASTPTSVGQDGRWAIWNPATLLARNVRITSVGNDSGATFTVSGYDVYGVPMTETITGANAGIASGIKTFKYIASVTPAGTLSGSNASVGTGDVMGLPLRADYFGDLDIVWNNAGITASTGFTAAVTTSPATATTGDVRGRYAVQSASDGTKRLQVFQTVSLANIVSVTGMFGVTQA